LVDKSVSKDVDIKSMKLSNIPMDHPAVISTIKVLNDFRVKHNLEFSPKVHLDNCFRKLAKWGMPCLCDPGKKCPCSGALDDINKTGMCRCKFFVSKKKYEELKGK